MMKMNRRKRKRREKRKAEAKKAHQLRQQLANEPKASDYIFHLPEILEITDDFPLLVCGRVPTKKQADDGNLKRQIMRIQYALYLLGAKNIIKEPPCEVHLGQVNRSGLELIFHIAREYGAIVVFETTDRIISAKDFNPKTNPTAQLTAKDFEELLERAKFIPIATILHPDVLQQKNKSRQELYTGSCSMYRS